MIKVLVTGANGLLGQHLVRMLIEQHFRVIASGKGPSRLPFAENKAFRYYAADLTHPFALHQVITEEQPELVIHAAAMTQVDECELHQDACAEVNVQGTINLLLDAETICKHFIYISSDFVFDGVKGNYKEDDDQNPLSWYGFSKVQAESMVETSSMSWAIVRTCLVYGNPLSGARSNIISWVKESLQQGKKIQVVSDQVRTPTYVEDLANGIMLIALKSKTGIFHIAGSDILTPFDMAIKTAELLHLDKTLIEKADASSFTQPAKRPPKTGLDITKAANELGFKPITFNEGLAKMLGE